MSEEPGLGREPEAVVLRAVVEQKLRDIRLPGFVVEFSPLEAALAGAFHVQAISAADAAWAPAEPIVWSDGGRPAPSPMPRRSRSSSSRTEGPGHGAVAAAGARGGERRPPYNAITGQRYHGINTILLQLEGREDPRWLTYRQAQTVGAQVRRGERGVTCQKWLFEREITERDAEGQPLQDDFGQARKRIERLQAPRLMLFTVFNAEQVDGLAPLPDDGRVRAWDPCAQAERLLRASGAVIDHVAAGGAFYRPGLDRIQLPKPERFGSASHYYATALHELGHWTGHASRLDRDLAHPFGSEGYAREELRAEIASLMLGQTLELGHDPGDHAAYVDHWIRILEQDPMEIFRAAADAERIQDFVLDLAPIQTIEPVQEATMAVAHASEHRERQIADEPNPERFYLAVDRNDKDEAKALGARWDRKRLSWYVPAGMDPARFVRWWPKDDGALRSVDETPALPYGKREYLAVPFAERQAAKAVGACWDAAAKAWYVGPQADLASLRRWRLGEAPDPRPPGESPEAEFAKALLAAGFILKEGHPIMDGRHHRLAVEGDKKGETGGFYFAHLDGHPAGYFKNHRLGVAERWKSLGYSAKRRGTGADRGRGCEQVERADGRTGGGA